MQQLEPAVLALADGTIFRGFGFGKRFTESNPVCAEVVFNTSMYGYQEIMTDPSYAGQMLCFTSPHIGNVGCNLQDLESSKVHCSAIIVRDLSPVVSNFRAEEAISAFCERSGIMGITGIDTRTLVSHLRDNGSQMGAMAIGSEIDCDSLVDFARAIDYSKIDYVREVSCKETYSWDQLPWNFKTQEYAKLAQSELWSRPHVVALDCGIKYNILRLLLDSGFRVSVAPATTDSKKLIELKPDALFLSNGPGDPSKLDYLTNIVRANIGKFPIFGICLGHQILAQAVGGKTYKLKFGHRGGNHPVRDERTKKVEITVQNHGYAVDLRSLPSKSFVSHINLNDQTVEGIDLPDQKAFSVQYHPESSPGPHDAEYLFRRFFESVVQGS